MRNSAGNIVGRGFSEELSGEGIQRLRGGSVVSAEHWQCLWALWGTARGIEWEGEEEDR